MSSSGRIIAVDFGEKRLGVAISDADGRVAHPLTVLDRTGGERDFARLADIIDEYGAAKVVVGFPRTMSGAPGPQAKLVEGFISELKKYLDLPVESYDERLSSKEAKAALRAAGLPEKEHKGKVDKVAAALFLQSYLDRRSRRERRSDDTR